MKIKNILALGLLLAGINLVAQTGKTFPSITGLTLENKNITVPNKNGKTTLLVMVFHRSAEDELKKWINPLYDAFMNQPTGKNAELAEVYDVNIVFIPAIGGLKMMVKEFKESTDKMFWPLIMDTDRTDMKAVKKQLGIDDGKTTYVMVLDKDGKILEVQTGAYKQDKLDNIEEACSGD